MMNKRTMFFKTLIVALALSTGIKSLLSIATNNPYDTQPIYTYLGLDKYYKERKNWHFGFHISPVYQHANTARDYCGFKVPGCDRLGKWNMFGIFFGRAGNGKQIGAIEDVIFTSGTLDTKKAAIDLSSGKNFVAAYPELSRALYAVANQTNNREMIDTRYRVNNNDMLDAVSPVILKETADEAGSDKLDSDNTTFAGLTDESNFKQEDHTFAYVSTPIDYEKIGIRFQTEAETSFGLGLGVKFGIADIKKRPLCNQVTRQDACSTPILPFVLEACFQDDIFNPTPDSSAEAQTDAKAIYCALFEPKTRDKIGKDLCISYKTYRKTTAEDLHVNLYWHYPVNCYDPDEDVAVRVVPYVAVGAWIPTGDEVDPDKIFSVSSGNDGFWALTLDSSMAFDFPMVYNKKQHIQINFGVGATIFSSRTLRGQRVPTSLCQAGIIPWKTAIRKEPGVSWYGNVSLKAEEFIDGLSAYFDFIYTQHTQDDIKLLGECDKTCDTLSDAQKKVFANGIEKLKCESEWKNQQINAGFNYRVCEFLSFGGAVQGHISGKRVMRTTTLLGTISLMF